MESSDGASPDNMEPDVNMDAPDGGDGDHDGAMGGALSSSGRAPPSDDARTTSASTLLGEEEAGRVGANPVTADGGASRDVDMDTSTPNDGVDGTKMMMMPPSSDPPSSPHPDDDRGVATTSASAAIGAEAEAEAETGAETEAENETAPPLPIDWTKLGGEKGTSPSSRIRLPSDVMEYSADPDDGETELVIVGTAGQKITKMGTRLHESCNPNLRHLVLRSHLITKMEGLDGFRHLELLELYDNQIEVLENLNDGEGGMPGVTLTVLDMSYNVIRDMSPVGSCPNLVELYLANNKLKAIAGIAGLSKLRKIDLGANRIRVMDESQLSGLTDLEELWLGKNKIESIGGLEKLTRLRRLDVQSNRLTGVENLTGQVETLEELYLSHNAITDEGASRSTGLALPFTNLTVLDLSRNRLTTTRPFAHLRALEELWLSGNEIGTFDDVEPLSVLGTREGGGARLEGIYLEFNPVADEFEYRKRLASMIPSLKQIDANLIRVYPSSSVGGMVRSTTAAAAAGGGLGRMDNLETRMRRLQAEAIAKAREEKEARDGEGAC